MTAPDTLFRSGAVNHDLMVENIFDAFRILAVSRSAKKQTPSNGNGTILQFKFSGIFQNFQMLSYLVTMAGHHHL